jgi:pimeloyl-ACP methyl ester carboxylesterase
MLTSMNLASWMATTRNKTLTVAGNRIAYVQAGEGAPMILLHGFPTSSYLFHRMIPLLAEHFTVYALDLMGYGGSVVRPNIPIHLEAQARMVGQFADALDLKPFTLVGHDLGGGIAQLIALHNPDWLRRMVLINSVVGDNFPILRISVLIWALKIPGMTNFLKQSSLLRWWSRSDFGIASGVVNKRVIDEDAIRHFFDDPFFHSPEGITRLLRAVHAQAENGKITRKILPGLSEIHTPTLILWGADDPYFSLKWPVLLRETIPGAVKYSKIPNAGHFCPLEQPDLIVDYILR